MNTVRERPQHHAGALALVFVAVCIFGIDRFCVEIWGNLGGKPWAHHVRILATITMVVAGAVGVFLMRHGHHRRHGVASLGERPIPTENSNRDEYFAEVARYELAVAQALVATFALTMAWLVTFLALAGWLVCLPDEPAFVRVIGSTVTAICALWILGALAGRRRAGCRLRDK